MNFDILKTFLSSAVSIIKNVLPFDLLLPVCVNKLKTFAWSDTKIFDEDIWLLAVHSPVFYGSLTPWGRVTHICFGKTTIIGSDNGLSPGRRQAIIWTNTGILLIGPLGTNFNEISIEIHILSFKKMHLKMSSAKWRPFYFGLNVLMDCWQGGQGVAGPAINIFRPKQNGCHFPDNILKCISLNEKYFVSKLQWYAFPWTYSIISHHLFS